MEVCPPGFGFRSSENGVYDTIGLHFFKTQLFLSFEYFYFGLIDFIDKSHSFNYLLFLFDDFVPIFAKKIVKIMCGYFQFSQILFTDGVDQINFEENVFPRCCPGSVKEINDSEGIEQIGLLSFFQKEWHSSKMMCSFNKLRRLPFVKLISPCTSSQMAYFRCKDNISSLTGQLLSIPVSKYYYFIKSMKNLQKSRISLSVVGNFKKPLLGGRMCIFLWMFIMKGGKSQAF